MNAINQFLNQLAKQLEQSTEDLIVNLPPSPELGDLSIAAFLIAKKLKCNPKQASDKILEALKENTSIQKLEQKGPYINIFFSDSFKIKEAIFKSQIEAVTMASQDPVVVEFSSPNTNKPQHLGHVRNNIYGQCVVNMHHALGQPCLAVNLVNDRGTHICKSMLAYEMSEDRPNPQKTGQKGDHLVGQFYIDFARKSEKEPELEKKAQEMLQKWEAGDESVRKLWATMREWVLDGFKTTYANYGIKFDRFDFESNLYKKGREVVLNNLEKGIFHKKENGAVAADLSDKKLDEKILIRGDGTSIYITQDLGVVTERYKDLGFSKCYYVVGSEQDYHFKVLFALAEKIQAPFAGNLEHLSYGMVYLPEGKMKSREGKVVDADDLLLETKNLVLPNIKARYEEFSNEEQDQIASKIALAAIKIYLLKVTPKKDIHYNPKEAISFEGDTGPYLLYCITRVKSILRKAAEESPEIGLENTENSIQLNLQDSEKVLLSKLLFYPIHKTRSCEKLNPSSLVSYLLEVAKSFNQFYRDVPVLKSATEEEKKLRLQLCKRSAEVLEDGLNILGVSAVDRM